MSCLVEQLSTYDHNNYIYYKDGEDSRGVKYPSLLQVPFIPENNYGGDDEYEHINV